MALAGVAQLAGVMCCTLKAGGFDPGQGTNQVAGSIPDHGVYRCCSHIHVSLSPPLSKINGKHILR